ncbi:SSI family serine proteinase inhibitor [Streptomyces sp. enrichment culture]|uniref:SSI family serine proteinase inhibitor n=1 Tax=Streptomyces sp. enrichment culture TaxID=1795815 RepID=UPI003F570149
MFVAAASALTAVASLAAGPSPAYAATAAQGAAGRDGDHLTVTVRDAGKGLDGTFELRCHPHGGDHPDPAGACAVAERNTRWGQDAFGPAPQGAVCTMQYGGPATARITGTWAGRPVDAAYDRRDGCRIARWDRLVPLLPDLGSPASP